MKKNLQFLNGYSKESTFLQTSPRRCFSILSVVLLFLLPAITFAQTSYYYNAGGTGVADVTSWGTNPNGTGTNPANFTTAGSVFNFTGNNSSKIVSLPPTWSVAGKVVVTNGVNVITDTLGLAGPTMFDVDSNSWFTIRDTINVNLGSLHRYSTVVYDGKVAMNILPASYGNISSTNDSSYKRKFAFGRAINIAGTFTPGKATYSDSSSITFNGTITQSIPTHSFFNLIVANSMCTIDSGSYVTIKTNGKLTVDTLLTFVVKPGGSLEYHTTKKPVLSGTLEMSTNGNFNITSAITNVPAGIVWDWQSNE